VIVPAETAVLFLGSQLGGFVVFAREEKHRLAVSNRDAARKQLELFDQRSRRSVWRVWATHSLTTSIIPSSVYLVAHLPIATRALKPLLLIFLLNAGFSGMLLLTAWFFRSSSDRFGKVLPWLGAGFVIVTFGFGAALSVVDGPEPAVAKPLAESARWEQSALGSRASTEVGVSDSGNRQAAR
jgi:hypothetical protein